MPAKDAEKIRKHILWYLAGGEAKPKLLVLIIDAKVGVTAYDRELISVARDEKHPLLLIANKIDKLNQRECAVALQKLSDEFPRIRLIPFSAKSKEGVSLMRDRLMALLGMRR